MRGSPSFNQPTSRRPLSQLALDRSPRKDRACSRPFHVTRVRVVARLVNLRWDIDIKIRGISSPATGVPGERRFCAHWGSEGATQFSPARQRWVTWRADPSPVGAAEELIHTHKPRKSLRDHQLLSPISNSFAMRILPVSSMESQSCRPNCKPLKTGNLRMRLSPMIGRSYGQVPQNTDFTIFNFSRFFSCHIHFVSTS